MDIKIRSQKSLFDFVFSENELEEEDGLETAVIISLFTDRRAETDDVLPDYSADRRGWWADQYSEHENDFIGSRLWLLAREKTLPAVAQRAEQYAREALQWLIDDGIAKSVTVTATREQNTLYLVIEILKPDEAIVKFKFDDIWGAICSSDRI